MLSFLLFAEADPGYAALLTAACIRAGLTPDSFAMCRNAQEAIGYMDRFAARPETAPSARVILDGNLPNVGGLDVLAWMSAHPPFDRSPVTVMGPAMSLAKCAEASLLGSAEILERPQGFHALVSQVRSWRGPTPLPA